MRAGDSDGVSAAEAERENDIRSNAARQRVRHVFMTVIVTGTDFLFNFDVVAISNIFP